MNDIQTWKHTFMIFLSLIFISYEYVNWVLDFELQRIIQLVWFQCNNKDRKCLLHPNWNIFAFHNDPIFYKKWFSQQILIRNGIQSTLMDWCHNLMLRADRNKIQHVLYRIRFKRSRKMKQFFTLISANAILYFRHLFIYCVWSNIKILLVWYKTYTAFDCEGRYSYIKFYIHNFILW